jgi:D-arginine dehydrogenase
VCYKPSVEIPTTSDVAIVGGGFAGLATARALARRGIAAIVLEREAALGRFASGRSAGLGRQLAEDDATSALTIRGAAILRGELAAVWQPSGGILSFDDTAAADDYAARATRFGIAVERLDRAGVAAHWPGAAGMPGAAGTPGAGGLPIAAALHVPSDGVIDVAGLLAALARGVRVECGAGVERLEPAGRGARLTTRRGAIEARVVVDAAGAWAGALTDDPPLASFKRHVYVVEAAAAPGTPYLWHLGAGEVYLRGGAGGLLVSPCDAAATAAADQQPDAAGEAALRARLAGSGWRTARILRSWACQRAFTADRRMRLGRDPARPWLVWAAGLGGHGATAAGAVGEVVAEACVAALDR